MFISIGRYRGIKKPLHQRSESEHSTLFRVILTWGLGMLLASPIPVLALVNTDNVMPAENVCEMNNDYFLVIGSLLSFYIPMVIMVTTYALTIHHLKKQKLCALAGQRHVVSKQGKFVQKDRSSSYSAADGSNTLTTSYIAIRNGHKDSFSSIAGTESTHRQVGHFAVILGRFC